MNIGKLLQVYRFQWISLLTATMFILIFTNMRLRLSTSFSATSMEFVADEHEGYMIKTKGCKIPDLPVFEENLQEYFEYDFDGPHCNKEIPPLVQSNLTALFVIESSLVTYKISDVQLLHCCYKELKRKIPQGERDGQYEFGDTCMSFNESIEVKEEFVYVKCTYDGKGVYQNFFAFVPLKHYNTSFDLNDKQNNVLIIGLDGVSRLNFHRQMPKTVSFLKKLEFVEFMGYNKIADNTYPNLITVLTGDNEMTIERNCKKSSAYFDKCSFIWDKFKANNYVTSFGEDSAEMGIFNHEKHGFQIQPTDYMWGFFDLIAERLLGNSRSLYVTQCIGAREGYKMLVQYIHDFVSQMETWKKPYFAFFWSASLSHDELNKPRIGDEYFLKFYQSLYDKGYFDNTIVIVMSDHGIRYGSFRQTYQGRIEERLPFVFVRLPKLFKEKYPLASSNLEKNAKVLTVPYDLHETLLDISSPQDLTDEFITNSQRKSKSKYGLSLFRQVPPTRTCEDAGIADHWCTCLKSKPVEITPEVMSSVNFTVDYINQLLKSYSQCKILRLKEVYNAQILSHSKNSMGSEGAIKDLVINFETLPGEGLFEATVRVTRDTKMEIAGSISRLNFYGNQSACIEDFHLKLYCYCEELKWQVGKKLWGG